MLASRRWQVVQEDYLVSIFSPHLCCTSKSPVFFFQGNHPRNDLDEKIFEYLKKQDEGFGVDGCILADQA